MLACALGRTNDGATTFEINISTSELNPMSERIVTTSSRVTLFHEAMASARELDDGSTVTDALLVPLKK